MVKIFGLFLNGKMTKRQLFFGISILATVIIVAGIVGYVSTVRYEQQSKINAQTKIEKTRIEKEAELERTQERMKSLPCIDND